MGSADGETRRNRWLEASRLWLPIVLSLCAIGLTVFQAVTTRRHTRLSVQPRVDWQIEQDIDQGTVTLSLVNLGFGPAVLTDVRLVHDGVEVGPPGPEACAEMNRRVGRDGPEWDTACFTLGEQHVVRAGDSVKLWASRPDPARGAESPAIARIDHARFAARARYCSFYDECWQIK